MNRLAKIHVEGFKSLGERVDLDFGGITVLLGANGSGKSNLVSFFRMVNHISSGALQKYVGESGMAGSLLHFGSDRTRTIRFGFEFGSGDWTDVYEADLSFYAPDGLFFTEERVSARQAGHPNPLQETLPSAGQRESQLDADNAPTIACQKTRRVISAMLRGCRVYQFHNTAPTAPLRTSCYIDQGAYLRGDGGNLPAFLLAMKNREFAHYQRIVRAVREMVPQFRDFVLLPGVRDETRILLNWIGERGDECVFGPHQLSDGSLRFIALAALLLQPESNLPDVIILDEPELGLHPAAIQSLAGMVDIASQNCQVVLATQSAALASQFEPESIRIVDYDQSTHSSTFSPLPLDRLKAWLEDYSLAELWDKNILGGRP
jgi:predicted ATPase